MLPLPIALNKHNINQLKKKKSINIMDISILLYIGLKNNFFKLSLEGVLLLRWLSSPRCHFYSCRLKRFNGSFDWSQVSPIGSTSVRRSSTPRWDGHSVNEFNLISSNPFCLNWQTQVSLIADQQRDRNGVSQLLSSPSGRNCWGWVTWSI